MPRPPCRSYPLAAACGALFALPAFASARAARAQDRAAPLFEYRPDGEARWVTAENPTGAKGQGGRENGGGKGHPFETLAPGASLVLADVRGAGTIQRVWLTVSDRSPEMLRSLRLEVYWDDARTPAVAAPVGDFFGAGAGQLVPFESALFASPEGRSFVSYVPMPFRTRARVVLTNESSRELSNVYYEVDYARVARQPASALYFHAHWRRERPTRLGEDFRVLPRVAGRGRYLGASVVVRPNPAYGALWWGEGAVKVYLDGDREPDGGAGAGYPTLVGTGTEDYVGSGWQLGVFAHRYQGSLVADAPGRRWSFYRFHVPDPVYFARDCEVTLQQIGGGPRAEVLRLQGAGVPVRPLTIDAGSRRTFRHLDAPAGGGGPVPLTSPGLPADGGVTFYREDDVAAVAYFYLDRPENGLPPLAPAAERVAGIR